jgi:PEP-CTERM motif
MRFISRASVAAALSIGAVSAQAAVSIISTSMLDPYGYGSLTLVETFSSASTGSQPASFIGDGYVQTVSSTNSYANPNDLANGFGSASNNFYTLPRATAGAPLDMAPYEVVWNAGVSATRFGLFWGSPDQGSNKVTFLLGGVEVGGAGNGTFSITSGDGQNANSTYYVLGAGGVFDQVRFSTGNIAFEFDNLAVAAVPEPGEWAMMLAGLGVVSLIARRRRKGN